MLYFPRAPNLFINAEGYLSRFLWFGPSDASKARATAYESAVAGLLFKINARHVGDFVFREIAAAKKRVEIRPHEFAGDDKSETDPNPTAVATSERDSYKKGSPYLKSGQQDQALAACTNYEDGRGGFKEATGLGSPVYVGFNPNAAFAAADAGPGSDKDSLLLHELVHAFRYARGIRNGCASSPAGYGSYEEFLAIVLTNIYDSEAGRPLRRDHEWFKSLPASLSSSHAFYDKFKDYLLPIRSEHPNLYASLKRATSIAFNPFTVMP